MMPGTVTITINSVPVSGIALNGIPTSSARHLQHLLDSSIHDALHDYICYSGDANSNSATDTGTTLTVNKATTAFLCSGFAHDHVRRCFRTLSGTIGAGSLFPPNGETVNITINSVTTPATIGANGAFSVVGDTHTIPASITPYTATLQLRGRQQFQRG